MRSTAFKQLVNDFHKHGEDHAKRRSVQRLLQKDGLRFVGRLKSNPRLEALAADHVYRPAGRPPAGGYEYTVELGSYQADSWQHSQRLILVVVDKPDPQTGQLNLMPRYFFLVTNWREDQRTAEELLAHYRPRGTFEDRLGEFNAAIGPQLSSQPFKDNEATMLLSNESSEPRLLARKQERRGARGLANFGIASSPIRPAQIISPGTMGRSGLVVRLLAA